MKIFVIETIIICVLFTVVCMSSFNKTMNNLELAKLDYHDALGIDCLWFCHSKRCVTPGTKDITDTYHDYMFHIKGSCVGMLIGLHGCLITGVIATLL